MEDNFYMCDLCQTQIASLLCICGYPCPRICVSCQSSHLSKHLGGFHSFLDVSLQTRLMTNEDVVSGRRKMWKIQEVESEVQMCTQEIEKCIQEIQTRGEELISAIRLHCSHSIDQLNELQSFLSPLASCISEAKVLIFQDNPSPPQSPLTSYLLKKSQGSYMSSETLFKWTKSSIEWDLNRYLGVSWKGDNGEKTGVDEEGLMEVGDVCDWETYKGRCIGKLGTVYSQSVAESIVESRTQTLEMGFYREQYRGLKSCLEVLETLRVEDRERLDQSVGNAYRSICPCKSQKLVSAYCAKTIELARKMINLEDKVSLPIQSLPEMSSIPPIPLLSPGRIHLYNIISQSVSTTLQPDIVTIDVYSVWVWTGSGRVVVSGGGSSTVWKSVYEVVPPDGVAGLREMKERRRLHGAVSCQEDVFVMGGSNGRPLKTAEYYSEKTWQSLPPMTEARYGFNPVLYETCIYIIGGEKSNTGEIFDIPKREFVPLRIVLPERSQTCALVIDKRLVVISKTKTSLWQLEDLSAGPEVTAHRAMHPWSNAPAVRYQDRVFVLLQLCGNCIPGSPLKTWDLRFSACSSVSVPI